MDAAVARGRTLGAIARAGQVGTQDMLARIPDPDAAGISGWIAEPEGNGVTVYFYALGADGAAPAMVYRGSVLGGRVLSRETYLTGERPPLPPLEARMAAARHIAEGQDHRACGADEFNYFVVPPTTPDGPIDVYQISPQSQRGRAFDRRAFQDDDQCRRQYRRDPRLHQRLPRRRRRRSGDRHPALADRGHPFARSAADRDPRLPGDLDPPSFVVAAGEPVRLFAVTEDRIVEIPH